MSHARVQLLKANDSVLEIVMNVSPCEEVRRFYETSADSYNEMMDGEINLPVYGEVLGEMSARIEGLDGAILDTSCGSGHMLQRIRDGYAPNRQLIGVDLSPQMAEISRKRLGNSATIIEGDMAAIPQMPDCSCACVISFYAIHHVGLDVFQECLTEWHRILVPGGVLLLAAWEGTGEIDYGDTSDIRARRYLAVEIIQGAKLAGFAIAEQSIKPMEEIGMDSVHLLATKRCTADHTE